MGRAVVEASSRPRGRRADLVQVRSVQRVRFRESAWQLDVRAMASIDQPPRNIPDPQASILPSDGSLAAWQLEILEDNWPL